MLPCLQKYQEHSSFYTNVPGRTTPDTGDVCRVKCPRLWSVANNQAKPELHAARALYLLQLTQTQHFRRSNSKFCAASKIAIQYMFKTADIHGNKADASSAIMPTIVNDEVERPKPVTLAPDIPSRFDI